MSQAINQMVPEGYKQTDIGVFPKDWAIKTIGEIATVSSGGTPNREVSEFWGGDIPWVTTTLINGDVISHANEFITQKGLENSSAKMCSSGTLLMAMYGQGKTRGKIGLLSFNASINQACAAISLYDKSSNQYVLHVLNSMYDEIRDLSNSGGQENLSGGIIKRITVPFPSSEEQTAIANALSDVDALLNEIEKLIAKKQAIKTATMQQLLTGKTRLPQFAFHPEVADMAAQHNQALPEDSAIVIATESNCKTNTSASATIINSNNSSLAANNKSLQSRRKGTKQSELGEIPEDWGIISIANLTRNIIDYRGRTPKKLGLDWGGGNIVALSAGNVKKGYIDFEEECYLGSEELYKKWMKNGVVEKNDIVFTMEAPLGNVALIPDSSRYILSQRTILLQLDRELYDPNFVYQLMMSTQFQSVLSDSATGSTAQGIKRSRFEQLNLCLAKNIEEQTAIATVLSDMDEEIQTLQQRLNKTRQIKQGMMQELLTGKTRLPFEKG